MQEAAHVARSHAAVRAAAPIVRPTPSGSHANASLKRSGPELSVSSAPISSPTAPSVGVGLIQSAPATTPMRRPAPPG
jgi:hypothetical protein